VWCILKFSKTGERLRTLAGVGSPTVPAPVPGTAGGEPTGNGLHAGGDRSAV
jgi:hypothetical protein